MTIESSWPVCESCGQWFTDTCPQCVADATEHDAELPFDAAPDTITVEVNHAVL